MVSVHLVASHCSVSHLATLFRVQVSGKLVVGNDIKACLGSLQNGESMWGNLVLVERGDCMFVEKARVIQVMDPYHQQIGLIFIGFLLKRVFYLYRCLVFTLESIQKCAIFLEKKEEKKQKCYIVKKTKNKQFYLRDYDLSYRSDRSNCI